MLYHILRKALSQRNIMSVIDEVSYSRGVLVCVTACKTLVGHVKEGKMISFLNRIADLPPLWLRWVDTGRIVSTRVQQENATLGRSSDIRHHALQIQTDGV